MDDGASVHIELDVAMDGDTVCGSARAAGMPSRTFVGWIGLNAAIDDLLGCSAGDLDGPPPMARDSGHDHSHTRPQPPIDHLHRR